MSKALAVQAGFSSMLSRNPCMQGAPAASNQTIFVLQSYGMLPILDGREH